MKKKCFAVYMLIISVALLSLPFAFGNWSQSVYISGYIKTAEIELEPKEGENSDEEKADKSSDNAGENDFEESSDSDDYEADKSEPDPTQDKKDDAGTDSGVTDTTNEGDKLDLMPKDEMIDEPPLTPEDAPVPAEEDDVEAEPESSSFPQLQQEMAEDGISKNPVENSSDRGGETAEIETEGDEVPAGSEAVPVDNTPMELEPDTSPVDAEDTKTGYSQDQTDEYKEYESEAKTTPET